MNVYKANKWEMISIRIKELLLNVQFNINTVYRSLVQAIEIAV